MSRSKAKSELKLSVVKALPERVELVELATTDADGQPIVVRCEAMDVRRASRFLNSLPGEYPKLGPSETVKLDSEKAERAIEVSLGCIALGTALSDGEGGFVRPAFYFDDAWPRDPRSLDGRCLPLTDIHVMGETVMRLSGYAGGAAAGRFPDRE